MSKLITTAPDGERVVVDYLTTALATAGRDVTVGVVIPPAWASGTKPHIQVAWDGTPEVLYPVISRASIRVTCWATTTTTAKSLAGICLAFLCAHPGGGGVASVQPLTGVLPARDPDTGAQLASVTVRVNLRMTVLT